MVNSTRSSASSMLELMVISDRRDKSSRSSEESRFIPVPSQLQLMQAIASGELQDLEGFLNIYWHVAKTETVFQAWFDAIKNTHNEKRMEITKLFYRFVMHKGMSRFELMEPMVTKTIKLTLNYLKTSYAKKTECLKELSEFEKQYYKKIAPLRSLEAHQAPFMFEFIGDPITIGEFKDIRKILNILLNYDTRALRNSIALKRWSQETIPGLLTDNQPLDLITLLAKQITAVQILIFKKINPFEFNKNKAYPVNYLHLARRYYNTLSQLVQELILTKDCRMRMNAIFVFKVVLEQLLIQRDFQSALPIYGSFSKDCIYRLKETWKIYRKHFAIEFNQAEKYEDILNEKNTYENAKKLFAKLDEAKVPYIPLLNTYEAQIAGASENLAKRDKEGNVNGKFINIFNCIMEKISKPIENYPHIQMQTDFFYYLRYVEPKSEELMMAKSYEIEPKTKRELELEADELREEEIARKRREDQLNVK